MTLPVSGAISLRDVNVELDLPAGNAISLNDAAVRTLFGKASGAISLIDGYGKTNPTFGFDTTADILVVSDDSPQSYNFTNGTITVYNSGVIAYAKLGTGQVAGPARWLFPGYSNGADYDLRITGTATLGTGNTYYNVPGHTGDVPGPVGASAVDSGWVTLGTTRAVNLSSDYTIHSSLLGTVQIRNRATLETYSRAFTLRNDPIY